LKPKQLLLLDVDGTSVNDDGILLAETVESLGLARAKGTIICFVTGRCEFEMETLMPQLSCADYLIVNNGSLIIDLQSGEKLINKYVAEQDAIALIELCLANNYLLHIKAGNYWGVNFFDESVKRFSDFAEKEPILYDGLHDIPLTQIEGFSITSDLACADIDALIADKNMSIKTVHSQAGYYDIMHDQVSKWAAIQEIAALHHISVDQMIAVGNFTNDVEMMRNAGTGVAVQNANELAKAAANFVTISDNNHNAVGEVIEKFLL
jgi:5-amino-6-(5-phospho-D-ribitylamino)uracil phosphatase